MRATRIMRGTGASGAHACLRYTWRKLNAIPSAEAASSAGANGRRYVSAMAPLAPITEIKNGAIDGPTQHALAIAADNAAPVPAVAAPIAVVPLTARSSEGFTEFVPYYASCESLK